MVDIASAAPRAGRIDLGGLWIAPPLIVVALPLMSAAAPPAVTLLVGS